MRIGRDFVDYDYAGPFSAWYFSTNVPDLKSNEYTFFSEKGLVKSNAPSVGHCPNYMRFAVKTVRLVGWEGMSEERPEDGTLRLRIMCMEDPVAIPFFVHHKGHEVVLPTPIEIQPLVNFHFALDDFQKRGKPLTLIMGVKLWKAR